MEFHVYTVNEPDKDDIKYLKIIRKKNSKIKLCPKEIIQKF